MDTRRIGQIFGWFFIGTFVTSIPARLLFVGGLGATWTDMSFVPGEVSENSMRSAPSSSSGSSWRTSRPRS